MPADELPKEIFRQWLEIANVRFVVHAQQPFCFCVTGLPGLPEMDGIPPAEALDLAGPAEPHFEFNVFEASPKAEPSCGKTKIKVGLLQVQPGEGRTEVGKVKPTAKESHQEGIARKLLAEALFRQGIPLDQGRQCSVRIEANHCDLTHPGRFPGGFNIEKYRSGPQGLKEPPMLS